MLNLLRIQTEQLNSTINNCNEELQELDNDKLKAKMEVKALSDIVNKLTLLADKKNYGKTRREKNATTLCPKSTNKYLRREETRQILEYIHGGKQGALNGAWDYLSSNGEKIIEDFLMSYKSGKYIEDFYGKLTSLFTKSQAGMDQVNFICPLLINICLSINNLPESEDMMTNSAHNLTIPNQ